MLRSVGSRQAICLRCRYRLTLQAFAQARQKGARSFTSTLRSKSETPQRQQENNEDYLPDELEQPRSLARFTAGSMRGGRQSGPTYHKRLPLNLNSIALEVNSLGNPASILRLNVNGSRKERRLPYAERAGVQEVAREEEEEQQAPETSNQARITSRDLLDSITVGPQSLSKEDIVPTVDSLRDEWLAGADPQAIPTAAQCYEVFKRLDRAFSPEQLNHYLEQTQSWDAEDYDDLQGFFEGGGLARSPWYSGQVSVVEPGSLLLPAWNAQPHRQRFLLADHAANVYGIKPKSYRASRKNLLIESILRRSWRLRTLEELQTEGCLDVRLDPKHCLLLQKFSLFAQLSKRLDVRITLNDKQDALRISGLHENCALALTAIFAPLQTVKSNRVDLGKSKQLHKLPYDQSILDTIADVSKVHLERDTTKPNHAFNVWFLAPQKADDSGLDLSAFETASQLLWRMSAENLTDQPLFFLPNEPSQPTGIPLELTSVLPPHLRTHSWIRCSDTRPAGPNQDNTVSSEAQDRVKALLHVTKTILGPFRTYASVAAPEIPLNYRWQREPSDKITLTTGYLALDTRGPTRKSKKSTLFEAKPNFSSTLLPQDLKSAFKTFAPAVPGGVSVLDSLETSEVATTSNVLIQLKPDGIVTGSNDKQWTDIVLPDLEIRLLVNPSGEGAQLDGVQLSLRHGSQQLMMAREHLDAVVDSQSIVTAEGEVDDELRRYVGGVVAVDGHVDERSIPRTLDLDIPLQATSMRPTFNQLATDSMKESGKRRLRGSLPASAPNDNLMKRARASDLLVTPDEKEYYEGAQPYSERSLSHARSEFQPVSSNADMDRQFDEPPHQGVTEHNISGTRSMTSNISADRPASPVDPNQLFEKSLGFRGMTPPPVNVRARYNFAGLEYHNQIKTNYKGCELLYMTVDGGDVGGRCEKLVLKAPNLAIAADDMANLESTGENKRKKQIRARICRSEKPLFALIGDRQADALADWLEKGVSMIKEMR